MDRRTFLRAAVAGAVAGACPVARVSALDAGLPNSLPLIGWVSLDEYWKQHPMRGELGFYGNVRFVEFPIEMSDKMRQALSKFRNPNEGWRIALEPGID